MRTVACMLLALAACQGFGSDPCVEQGIPQGCGGSGGSAMLSIADYGLTFSSNDCVGVGAEELANYRYDPDQLTLGVTLHDSARSSDAMLTCGPVRRAELVAARNGTPLAMLCTPHVIVRSQPIDPQLYGACCGNLAADVPAGTLTVTSNLDSNGNGQMSLQLDIPPTDVAGFDASTNSTHMMHVEVTGLSGVTIFAAAMINAPSCQIQL